MLFENFSANVDSVRNTMFYVGRCEGFKELVLGIQGVVLAHRYVRIFRAYHLLVAKRTPLVMENGQTQESQVRLHEVGPHLSSTGSFEAVYKALRFRQLVPPNPAFQVEYRNCLR